MKRVLILTSALIMLVCSVYAEGSQESGSDTTTLKFNCIKGAMDPDFSYWSDFSDDITDASNGSLNVEIYPSTALGKASDVMEAISQGAAMIQDSDPSYLADYVADFGIFMHPYLFTEPEHIEKVWKSEIGQNMVKELEAKGIHIITLVYFGTRHLISDKSVMTREDTAGMKIRCAPTKMWNQVPKVLGGNPTNTAWAEVYTALSQGVADAAESPLSLLYSAKLYEPKNHISLTGHLVAPTAIVMSQVVYESLSADAKAAIDKIGDENPAKRIDFVQTLEKEVRGKLEAEGVVFNDVDKSGFLEAAKSVSDDFPEWTPNLYADIRKILE